MNHLIMLVGHHMLKTHYDKSQNPDVMCLIHLRFHMKDRIW